MVTIQKNLKTINKPLPIVNRSLLDKNKASDTQLFQKINAPDLVYRLEQTEQEYILQMVLNLLVQIRALSNNRATMVTHTTLIKQQLIKQLHNHLTINQQLIQEHSLELRMLYENKNNLEVLLRENKLNSIIEILHKSLPADLTVKQENNTVTTKKILALNKTSTINKTLTMSQSLQMQPFMTTVVREYVSTVLQQATPRTAQEISQPQQSNMILQQVLPALNQQNMIGSRSLKNTWIVTNLQTNGFQTNSFQTNSFQTNSFLANTKRHEYIQFNLEELQYGSMPESQSTGQMTTYQNLNKQSFVSTVMREYISFTMKRLQEKVSIVEQIIEKQTIEKQNIEKQIIEKQTIEKLTMEKHKVENHTANNKLEIVTEEIKTKSKKESKRARKQRRLSEQQNAKQLQEIENKHNEINNKHNEIEIALQKVQTVERNNILQQTMSTIIRILSKQVSQAEVETIKYHITPAQWIIIRQQASSTQWSAILQQLPMLAHIDIQDSFIQTNLVDHAISAPWKAVMQQAFPIQWTTILQQASPSQQVSRTIGQQGMIGQQKTIAMRSLEHTQKQKEIEDLQYVDLQTLPMEQIFLKWSEAFINSNPNAYAFQRQPFMRSIIREYLTLTMKRLQETESTVETQQVRNTIEQQVRNTRHSTEQQVSNTPEQQVRETRHTTERLKQKIQQTLISFLRQATVNTVQETALIQKILSEQEMPLQTFSNQWSTLLQVLPTVAHNEIYDSMTQVNLVNHSTFTQWQSFIQHAMIPHNALEHIWLVTKQQLQYVDSHDTQTILRLPRVEQRIALADYGVSKAVHRVTNKEHRASRVEHRVSRVDHIDSTWDQEESLVQQQKLQIINQQQKLQIINQKQKLQIINQRISRIDQRYIDTLFNLPMTQIIQPFMRSTIREYLTLTMRRLHETETILEDRVRELAETLVVQNAEKHVLEQQTRNTIEQQARNIIEQQVRETKHTTERLKQKIQQTVHTFLRQVTVNKVQETALIQKIFSEQATLNQWSSNILQTSLNQWSTTLQHVLPAIAQHAMVPQTELEHIWLVTKQQLQYVDSHDTQTILRLPRVEQRIAKADHIVSKVDHIVSRVDHIESTLDQEESVVQQKLQIMTQRVPRIDQRYIETQLNPTMTQIVQPFMRSMIREYLTLNMRRLGEKETLIETIVEKVTDRKVTDQIVTDSKVEKHRLHRASHAIDQQLVRSASKNQIRRTTNILKNKLQQTIATILREDATQKTVQEKVLFLEFLSKQATPAEIEAILQIPELAHIEIQTSIMQASPIHWNTFLRQSLPAMVQRGTIAQQALKQSWQGTRQQTIQRYNLFSSQRNKMELRVQTIQKSPMVSKTNGLMASSVNGLLISGHTDQLNIDHKRSLVPEYIKTAQEVLTHRQTQQQEKPKEVKKAVEQEEIQVEYVDDRDPSIASGETHYLMSEAQNKETMQIQRQKIMEELDIESILSYTSIAEKVYERIEKKLTSERRRRGLL